ncbi:MAG: BMP family ABC transporter substrate-binding protein [Anaerolineaceae bacterium]|jgi:basic membrane protein A
MSKKIFTILSFVLVAAMLLSACTTPAKPADAPAAAPTEADCSKEEVICIGLVTDVGEVDDKNFNQASWEGVQQGAKEVNALANYIETKDAKDYAANIQLFIDKGYDVIVTVGFALTNATVEAAVANPKVSFIGVDQFQEAETPGVAGLIFDEAKSGFLAGVLAGMLTETKVIAAVLGTDLVPPVVNFNRGYVGGAKWVDPEINVISTYHPGGMDVAFVDPEWGAATAKQAISQKADVVFGAGGKTGNGALIESAGHEGVFCIGVDTDQWLTVPEAHKCLVSSATKDITASVVDLIKLAKDGKFPSGNYLGGSSLAPFHDFDSVITQEIKDKLAAGLKAFDAGEVALPDK